MTDSLASMQSSGAFVLRDNATTRFIIDHQNRTERASIPKHLHRVEINFWIKNLPSRQNIKRNRCTKFLLLRRVCVPKVVAFKIFCRQYVNRWAFKYRGIRLPFSNWFVSVEPKVGLWHSQPIKSFSRNWKPTQCQMSLNTWTHSSSNPTQRVTNVEMFKMSKRNRKLPHHLL